MTNTTCVGKINNTHGIKGYLKIEPYTNDIERFSDLDYLLVGEDFQKYSIENVFYKGRFAFIKFKEFDNINLVLKFKNFFVYIYDKDRVVLPEDSYFISDLIGCKVVDLNNNHIGEIVEVIENPVNDVYVVKDNSSEYLIPARKEFVKSVNIDKKTVVVDPIEGMVN